MIYVLLLFGGITTDGVVPYATATRYVKVAREPAIVLLHQYDRTTLKKRGEEVRKKLNKQGVKVVLSELNIKTNRKLWQDIRQPSIPCLIYLNYDDRRKEIIVDYKKYIPARLDITPLELMEWVNTGKVSKKYQVKFGLCPKAAGISSSIPVR